MSVYVCVCVFFFDKKKYIDFILIEVKLSVGKSTQQLWGREHVSLQK